MKRISIIILLALAVIIPFLGSQHPNGRGTSVTQAETTNPQNPYSRYLSTAPLHETRAVWLTTYLNLDWPTRRGADEKAAKEQQRELCAILDSLKNVGINTVLFQTRLRATVIYPSAIEPWDECMTGQMGKQPAYDPLRFAIDECHKRGMELHAWVVTIPYYKKAKAKQQQPLMKGSKPGLILHDNTYYLDPSSTSTDDYLSAIFTEIVRNYDVDGISLDYIRYPENAQKLNDTKAYKQNAAGLSKPEWRRQNITRIVNRLYHDVKAIKPWVKFTSSPLGKYADLANHSSGAWNARDAVYQDPQKWMRDGVHDGLFPMMYYRGDNFYPFAQDWKENSCGKDIAPGLGIYFLSPKEQNWPLADITGELEFLRKNGMGQCFFRTRFLLDNVKGLYDWLADFNGTKSLPMPLAGATEKPAKPEWVSTTYYSIDHARLEWHNDEDSDMRYNVYLIDDEAQTIDLLESFYNSDHFDINPRLLLNKPYKIGVSAMNRYGTESELATVASKEAGF